MPALLPIALASSLVFFAAILRGYSGLGFSLLAITSLSLIFAPAQVIPAIFKSADPARFRRIVLVILACLAVMTAAKAVLGF